MRDLLTCFPNSFWPNLTATFKSTNIQSSKQTPNSAWDTARSPSSKSSIQTPFTANTIGFLSMKQHKSMHFPPFSHQPKANIHIIGRRREREETDLLDGVLFYVH